MLTALLFLFAQDIESEILKLGSERPSERAAATVFLMEAGEPARVKLLEAAKVDKTRWAAQAILEELRARRDGGAAWNPKRVSVKANDKTASAIFEELRDAYPHRVSVPDGLDRPVSVDLDRVTPLTVLQTLADRLDANFSIEHLGSFTRGGVEKRILKIMLKPRTEPTTAVFETPNYVVLFKNATAKRVIDFKNEPRKEIVLTGTIRIAPNLPVVSAGKIQVAEARDASGDRLDTGITDEMRSRSYAHYGAMWGREFRWSLVLPCPQTPIERIALLRGAVDITTHSGTQDVTFTDIELDKPQQTEVEGVPVTLTMTRNKWRHYVVRIKLGSDKDENLKIKLSQQSPTMINAKGNTAGNTGGSFGTQQQSANATSRPVKVVVTVVTGIFDRTLHFELTDIPLQ